MGDIHSISAFVGNLGASFRVYDLGRRVTRLATDEFLAFENALKPYPYPLQQQAWFAVLHWSPDRPENQIVWFIKMPLDEQGLLVQVARDDFLRQLVLESEAGGAESDMQNSGYAFTPKEDRMAMFHGLATRALNQPPSSYYDHARDYLAGGVGYDQWSFVGLQGFADMVARLAEDDNARLIQGALSKLPVQPLIALTGLLENQIFDVKLAEAILKCLRLQLKAESPDLPTCAALMRALASSQATGLRDQAVCDVLNSPLGTELEVLVSVGGRIWESLKNQDNLMLYLERLAESAAGQPLFGQLILDLLFVPGMRDYVMQGFRHADRSEKLSATIGVFMQAVSA